MVIEKPAEAQLFDEWRASMTEEERAAFEAKVRARVQARLGTER